MYCSRRNASSTWLVMYKPWTPQAKLAGTGASKCLFQRLWGSLIKQWTSSLAFWFFIPSITSISGKVEHTRSSLLLYLMLLVTCQEYEAHQTVIRVLPEWRLLELNSQLCLHSATGNRKMGFQESFLLPENISAYSPTVVSSTYKPKFGQCHDKNALKMQ